MRRFWGVRLDRDSLSLTINHYNVERLASALQGGWGGLQDKFPVVLNFEDVRELHVVVDAELGLYRKLRASLRGLSKALDDVVALRCIGYLPDAFRLHLEINVRHSRWIEVEPGAGIVPGTNMLLECGRIAVVEDLRQNWIDHVGEGSVHLLDALERAGPAQRWSMPDFDRFIENNR